MKIIISPSGKLYGSENVLFDYVKTSNLKFHSIFVPSKSPLFHKLYSTGFKSNGYINVHILYFRILLYCIFKNVDSIYCNEAGHIRYIKILAYLFPQIKFIVHVRILEDTNRVNNTLNNLLLLTVSKNIQKKILVKNKLIYDGYDFDQLSNWKFQLSSILKVGIVGRVTKTKGVEILTSDFFEKSGTNIEYHFYGELDNNFIISKTFEDLNKRANVFFHGFVSDKNNIYNNIDLLMHLNPNEPLGRIFFESLDFGIPFLGISEGGIAEIAYLICYPYICSKEQIPYFLNDIANSKIEIDFLKLNRSRNLAIQIFSIYKYTFQVDNFIL
jgi:hypothetical protein